MLDRSQLAKAVKRRVEIVIAPLRALVDSLIEFTTIKSYSTGENAVGSATSDEGEQLTIVETYGVASRPPGTATGLVLAPGGDTSGKVLIGSVSPAGRPATAAGDTVLWTAAGHQVHLENDGPITVTSKDGPAIILDTDGNVFINVAALKKVFIGDDLAEKLTKVERLLANMDTALAAGIATPPTPMAGNNGSLAMTNFKTAWDAANASNPMDTEKAMGS